MHVRIFPPKERGLLKKYFVITKNVLLATVCTSNYCLYRAIKFITLGVISIACVTAGRTFRASRHASTADLSIHTILSLITLSHDQAQESHALGKLVAKNHTSMGVAYYLWVW